MAISPMLRQLYIALSPQFAAFAIGGAITYPGVLLQQLNGNNSSIELDMDTASWIGSIHGITGLPAILMPTVMQWRGRKFAFLAACFLSFIGWVLAYTATSVSAILVSESFHGLGTHCLMPVSLLSLSELVAPRFRNISMVAFYCIQALGITTMGIIARFFHWRAISIIMGTSTVISFLCALLWPQSPSWLAYKGKYKECKQAFVWLRGTDDESMGELEELIAAQKENRSKESLRKLDLNSFWQTVKSKDFYLPSIFMFLLLNVMYWSGTAVIIIYGTDMIYKATGNHYLASNGTMIVNIILFIGIITTNVLIKYFNNKSVLLFSVSGTAIFSFCTCVVTFLQVNGTLPKDSTLFVYGLACYMVANSLGTNSIVFTMAAELMPVKHRGVGGALFIIFTCVLHSSALKLAPYMFLHLGLSGTFIIYTCNSIICGLLIWIYVPETKGRTLQEVEDYYIKLKFEKRALPSQYTRSMIKSSPDNSNSNKEMS